jgi:hypothetical protein
MPENVSPIEAARLASALTTDDICTLLGLSREDYEHAEQNPLTLPVWQLQALAANFNSDGRAILASWLKESVFAA